MERNAEVETNGSRHYRNGLAIGGGSGNLFWKGAKIVTQNDISELDYTDTAVANQYVSEVNQTDGVISVKRTTLPTAGAGTVGMVKGFHRTSGTATGTKTTNATDSPAINSRTTTSDKYYGVETDATGAMYVNVPWVNTGTNITLNDISKSNSTASFYAPTTSGISGQILKSNGPESAPTWIDGASLVAPKKITLVATTGQTSFAIPFEYDSLSSNLTVYFNGILMKETDNYTVDTTNNTVDLVDFSAETGDIVTIMGLLGAQSIDFGQEAIDAINEINAAVAAAKEEIDDKVQTAFTQIDAKIDEIEAFVNELPDDTTKLMAKNTNNTMEAGYKITMDSGYTPSDNYDVTTKIYVDSAIASLVTDIYQTGSTAPSNTKLLWIDTGTTDPGLKYYNGSSWVTVPVRWS